MDSQCWTGTLSVVPFGLRTPSLPATDLACCDDNIYSCYIFPYILIIRIVYYSFLDLWSFTRSLYFYSTLLYSLADWVILF